MEIRINAQMVKAIGVKALKPWGISQDAARWERGSSSCLDLRRENNASVDRLRALLGQHTGVHGIAAALRDLDMWVAAAKEGPSGVKCRLTKHFAALVFEFIQKLPGYRIYKRDEKRNVWRAYYVAEIEFTEKHKDYQSGRMIPSHTDIELRYQELGVVKSQDVLFEDSDVRGKTVVQVLASEGYVVETPELLKDYEILKAKYDAIFDKVGMQFWASGVGTDDLDERSGNRWGRDKVIVLDRDAERSRVVIDILNEKDEEQEERDANYDADFWRQKSFLDTSRDDSLDDLRPEDTDPDEPELDFYIPLFPVVPTFDLRRHVRLRIHVGNLTEYVYDDALGEKLILPGEVRDLVSLLISDKTEFRDIVKGKGGGAVILCAGPPGCGKTLTAEVYAEFMHRPLYSVQCSQLGTDEEALEAALLKVFRRSQRWGSILLLDEADVYVAARGSNLQQNAIVGVFLRVLEYYGGVLFMTTNRSDLVDDAITSRCLARIDYTVPTPEDQGRIWRVLAEGSGLDVPGHVVTEIVTKYPRLSGRDVKQLLKLSAKVLGSRGKKVLDLKTVDFVKRFKPTPGGDETTVAATGKRLVPAGK